jgi:hypothetical protein
MKVNYSRFWKEAPPVYFPVEPNNSKVAGSSPASATKSQEESLSIKTGEDSFFIPEL